MAGERWNFTKSQLLNTPSRKCGIDIDKELSYRQQAANLIQDMGQRLQTNQLCINTAIVYMHRFYMFHSFTKFNRNVMSPACLFLAAKVEEQPRKLEHVIKTSHSCLQREGTLDTKSETYLEYAQELIINENILLQTLGFEVRVDHPHTTVVTTCQLVRASKDLAQTSYFLATNSLHLTTMCLQYKPNVVACVCIHLACKWSGYEIPSSHEGKSWFSYVDPTVTIELLEELTQDFLNILDKCPSRLKKKIMVWKTGKGGSSEERSKSDGGSSSKSGAEVSNKSSKQDASGHARNLFEDSQSIINEGSQDNTHSSRSQQPTTSSSSRSVNDIKQSQHPAMTYKDYKHHKDRKERERMSGHHSQSQSSSKSHGNGDVKRSHTQHDRKVPQSAYDGLHHLSRDDPSKRHDPKRQHESPSKMSLKSNRDDKHVNKMADLGMKVSKRPHQSDNEGSDSSERYSKHRRSETHPASADNSFSTGTINHSDLFLSGGSRAAAQNMYMGIPHHPKMDSGNGGTTSYKNKTSYDSNSERSMWANVKSTKSPNLGQHLKIPSKKDRSIFSPPQPPSSSGHRPPTPPHLLQSKTIPPPAPHMLQKNSGHGGLNASFDQSFQHGGGNNQGGGGHSGSYSHPQYMYMQGSYPDAGMGAVQGMNSNGAGGGSLSSSNLNPKVLQAQLQHLIAHQEYEIAATQQKMQSNHESPMSAMFGLDLLESDLGTMPPLPPPLPQSNAPQPPPPPY